MTLFRHLIRTLLVLFIAVFGSTVAIAATGDWSRIEHSLVPPQLSAQRGDLVFAARAPPQTGDSVAITGASSAGTGDVRVLYDVTRLGSESAFAHSTIAPNRTLTQYPDGTFSVSDWSGYPSGVRRPPEGTTYRLLTGSEYTEARRLANNANAQLRRSGVVPEGYEIHEIVPVKYGGSPTDPANKVYLPRGVHRSEVTPWWNRLQRDLE